jgi:hypothetical protein
MMDRFQVIDGGKRENVTAMHNLASRTADGARRAKPCARVMRLRQLAEKVRALGREVETETELDAIKLRSYAIHLENVAEMLEGHPL